jgi:malonyl-CoA O-methyltransferase
LNSILRRFNSHAAQYARLNTLQSDIAALLAQKVRSWRPKRILDLGAGSGAVFSAIDWEVERFVAVDFSPNMCALHPRKNGVEVLCANFDSPDDLSRLNAFAPFDLAMSSSSLQWARDLSVPLALAASFAYRAAFAIFTDGTLKTLHCVAGTRANLRSYDETAAMISRFFDVTFERREFRIRFANTRELFRYIKDSGIGGGFNTLGTSKARKLVREYPHAELEFETLFAVSR